jgi:hypothetical protein
LAQLRELQLARERGELVRKVDLIATWQAVLSVFVARASALPVRLAVALGTDRDSRVAIESEARLHVNEMLRELGDASGLPQDTPAES